MKLLAFTVVTALGALGTVAAADVSVLDNNKTLTVDCAKDKEVRLIGNHLAVTLTGTCTKVSITGNHETVTGAAGAFSVAGIYNTLSISAADTVTVAGNNNALTLDKGVKAKPANSGKDNKITIK
jgi:hypothetical protein